MNYDELTLKIEEQETQLALLHARHVAHVAAHLQEIRDQFNEVGLVVAWNDIEPWNLTSSTYVVRVYESQLIFEHKADFHSPDDFRRLQEAIALRVMPYYEKKKACVDLQRALPTRQSKTKMKV